MTSRVLLVALCLFATACSVGRGAEAPEADPGRAVRVQTVHRADVAQDLVYVADLEPSARVRVYSPVADRILAFPWEDGDEIRAGEEIALVRRDGFDRGLDQITAQIEALDAQLRTQEQDLARFAELLEAGVMTQQAYDQAEGAWQANRAQRRSLEASRDQLAITAGNARLTAPMDGVVAERAVEPGDMASPQLPLCSILQVHPLELELRLVEADVPRVQVGQEVRVEVEAWPGREFVGEIARIRPYLDPVTRTNAAVVVLDNPPDAATGMRPLKPGMFGTATLVVDQREQVVVAPEAAFLIDPEVLAAQSGDQTLRKAWVVGEHGRADERVVELGVRDGSTWEVVSGLSEGEQLVVVGQHGLRQGDSLAVQGDATL